MRCSVELRALSNFYTSKESSYETVRCNTFSQRPYSAVSYGIPSARHLLWDVLFTAGLICGKVPCSGTR